MNYRKDVSWKEKRYDQKTRDAVLVIMEIKHFPQGNCYLKIVLSVSGRQAGVLQSIKRGFCGKNVIHDTKSYQSLDS